MTTISTAEELEQLYPAPLERALRKELDHVAEVYRPFIDEAPFCLLATSGPNGLDVSPRGDAPGFVHLEDPKTLILPDRRGNNRLDSLRNIIADPRVALLFMIPGIGETLRISGTAEIIADPEACERFSVSGKAPLTLLVVHAERVYFQCQKALHRSNLWDASAQVPRDRLPSAGTILAAVDQGFDGAAYDRDYPDHMKKTIY